MLILACWLNSLWIYLILIYTFIWTGERRSSKHHLSWISWRDESSNRREPWSTTSSRARSTSSWTSKSASRWCWSKRITSILSSLWIRLFLTLSSKILIILLKHRSSTRRWVKLEILSSIYYHRWSLCSFSSCLINILWLIIDLFKRCIHSFHDTGNSSLFLVDKFINKIIYGMVITTCKQSWF
jgi:hypothetical protein